MQGLATFNLAKGILVVDPIEARGIRVQNRTTSTSKIYLLFQIETRVLRSHRIPTNTTLYQWSEDSQCRFEISPGIIPVLTVYLMQDTKPVPTVVGQGSLNLIDVFYERKADRWVKLNTVGQINLELTFYAIAPLVPRKVDEPIVAQQLIKPVEKSKTSESTQQLISAVDLVFDDNKVEKSRLRKLAKKVKRRYRESMKDDYEYQNTSYVGNSSAQSLALEVETSSEQKKPLPAPPGKDNAEILLSSNAVDLKPSPSFEFDELSIRDLDIKSLPFSANAIGGENFKVQLKKAKQKEIQERTRPDYKTLSPEAYFFIDRLQKGMLQPGDFYVESGASEYKGDGTWNKGCLRDSVRTEGPPPKLPPKIPVGMREEEYFVTNRDDCIEYFKKNTILI